MFLIRSIEEMAKWRETTTKLRKGCFFREIPSPIYLDGHARWREKDIDEWIQGGCRPIQKPVKEQVDVQIFKGNLNLKQIKKATIVSALDVTKGNREKAAILLGVGERTVYRKISEYGIS